MEIEKEFISQAQRDKTQAETYWRKLLCGFTNTSSLGIKKSRIDLAQRAVHLEQSITLPSELQIRLKAFTQTHQISTTTLLQGVWGFLLSYYTGSDDVVFGGTPLKSEIGLQASQAFADIIPIRIKISPKDRVIDYLSSLQQQINESSQVRRLNPLEIKLISEIHDQPLYDHIFQFKRLNNNEKSGSPLIRALVENYELCVIATETNQFWMKINFNENVYSQTSITRLLKHYQKLLQLFTQCPDQKLVAVPILTQEEHQQIVINWNKTTYLYPRDKTLPQLFEEQVEEQQNNVAVIFENQKLTYKQLNEKANQLARHLRHIGVQRETLIAICMEPSPELLISIIGTLKAGGAYVPLDPHNPEERLRFMLEDTKAAVLITHSKRNHAFEKNAIIVCIDQILNSLDQSDTTNLNLVNTPEDLAYVIYTSGSTGRPKGVMVTHRNVNNFIHWFSKALPFSNDDIFDFSSSISFDFCVPNTLLPIMKGAKIAICPESKKKDPSLYIEHLEQNNVAIIKLTPSYFRQLKGFVNAKHEFTALKYIVFGGESAYAKDVLDWLERFPQHRIFNEYGPTETTVATSWIVIDKDNIHSFSEKLPIGKPALNTQLYILNKYLEPLPIGIVGELFIGGEGVAAGYLNHAEITRKKFIPDFFSSKTNSYLYRTGDLCRFLEDGNIEFIGRVDQQVKIRGFRIEIREIEAYLEQHPLVKEVVITVRENEDDQPCEKQLIAYCVPENMQNLPSVRELQQHLHQHLPEYMIPSTFMMVNAFPLTPNGKLDRKALPTPEFTRHQQYIAPRSALEKIIQDIWSEVLNLKLISIDDDFFEIGGHSLSAARIISKIKKIKNKEIRLNDFYSAPTIQELAVIIEQASDINEINPTSAKESFEHNSKVIPLSEMQFLFWLAQKFFPTFKGLNIIDRRRICGDIDIAALRLAFEAVFNKHPILRYHVSKFIPKQSLQKDVDFEIDEKNLAHLTAPQQEMELFASLDYLKNFRWKKGHALVKARLFRLGKNISELQICMAHIISDEVSPTILFSDLSKYYKDDKFSLSLTNNQDIMQYKDYMILERRYLMNSLPRDLKFWEEYMSDAATMSFPADVIVNANSKQCFTTYLAFPEQVLQGLQLFCAKNRLNITNSFCAAIAMVVTRYLDTQEQNKKIVIGFLKSTRDTEIYDETIGFFVRTDIIKMKTDDNPSLIELTKRVQQSVAETEPYQFTPHIVKLAYLLKNFWANNKFKDLFIKTFAYGFARLLPELQLTPDVLMMYVRLFLARRQRVYLVTLNILNNFMLSNIQNNDNKLFGHELQKVVKKPQEERMVAKNSLDIYFERDSENKAYIVISGNVKSSFREKIGRDIIDYIEKSIKLA